MSFKLNIILFLIFNLILIKICDSVFELNFNKIDEEGCKQYGIKCDGENKSVKFNKEEIKHLKHYKDSKLAKSSIIKNASKHKGIYAPGEESTYRAESSYYTVKKAEEGILPVEIDKSKFHGAFRFDQSKCILKLI
uniref:Astacin domain-containing protein n=1 Tax=Meloidogyne hapla TaxID=6305 RepID=A0A1I8BH59_MELHA